MTFDDDHETPDTFTATIGGLRQVDAGDSVVVRFPPEAIHVFDADSGEAVLNRSLDTAEGVDLVL
jgi:multiple sugar transport system ATP-binding protein